MALARLFHSINHQAGRNEWSRDIKLLSYRALGRHELSYSFILNIIRTNILMIRTAGGAWRIDIGELGY